MLEESCEKRHAWTRFEKVIDSRPIGYCRDRHEIGVVI